VIRFGVVLSVVLIAIGLLVTGVVAGSLLLVVISIGVALLAFLVLIGVVISFRHEIFGRTPLDIDSAQPSLKEPAVHGAMARSAAQAGPAMATSRPSHETAARPGAKQAVRPGAEQAVRPGAEQAARPGAEQAARPGAEQAARPGAEQAARPPRVWPAERRGQDRSGRPQDDVGDRSRGNQPPAQPVPKPAPAETADRGQQTATTRAKAQPAPLPKAPTKAERAAPAPSGSRAGQDEPAERERSTGNFEGSDRNVLAAQHGAARLDRPSGEQPAEQAHAEPRRPSRLERESARAAGSRPAAPDPSSSGGRSADAAERPEVFRPAATGAAVSGAAAKPAPAATPAGGGARTGEPDADATASDSAAGPARAQAGQVVTGSASTDLASADLAGNEQVDTQQVGTKQAVGTEPDAPVAEGQAGAGEPGQAAATSQPASDGHDDGAARESSAAGDDEMQVSVVPGITRYHKSDCQLIRFLSADDLDVMTKRAATEAGCVPCKACKPDQFASGATSG
jgi:hypothetical protein